MEQWWISLLVDWWVVLLFLIAGAPVYVYWLQASSFLALEDLLEVSLSYQNVS